MENGREQREAHAAGEKASLCPTWEAGPAASLDMDMDRLAEGCHENHCLFIGRSRRSDAVQLKKAAEAAAVRPGRAGGCCASA